MSPHPRARLVCLGGPLAGDDAIALLAGDELARRGVPVERASDASQLLDLLSEPADYLVADAAVGLPRGAVAVVPARALLRSGPALSTHGLDVETVVALATRLWTAAGSVTLVGIGLGDTPQLDATSDDLRERVPAIADAILALGALR